MLLNKNTISYWLQQGSLLIKRPTQRNCIGFAFVHFDSLAACIRRALDAFSTFVSGTGAPAPALPAPTGQQLRQHWSEDGSAWHVFGRPRFDDGRQYNSFGFDLGNVHNSALPEFLAAAMNRSMKVQAGRRCRCFCYAYQAAPCLA
jgi:hypothetical protein